MKRTHRYAALAGVLLLCLLAGLWHFRNSSYTLDLEPEEVKAIEITYHSDSVRVTDSTQAAAILENFNRLTLRGRTDTATGWVYRVKFLDGAGQILLDAAVKAEDAMQGREVVVGSIDMALLQAAFEAGEPFT